MKTLYRNKAVRLLFDKIKSGDPLNADIAPEIAAM